MCLLFFYQRVYKNTHRKKEKKNVLFMLEAKDCCVDLAVFTTQSRKLSAR